MALKSLNSFRLQENSETAYHMWESYIPLYNSHYSVLHSYDISIPSCNKDEF